jgi:hypothetical protein
MNSSYLAHGVDQVSKWFCRARRQTGRDYALRKLKGPRHRPRPIRWSPPELKAILRASTGHGRSHLRPWPRSRFWQRSPGSLVRLVVRTSDFTCFQGVWSVDHGRTVADWFDFVARNPSPSGATPRTPSLRDRRPALSASRTASLLRSEGGGRSRPSRSPTDRGAVHNRSY